MYFSGGKPLSSGGTGPDAEICCFLFGLFHRVGQIFSAVCSCNVQGFRVRTEIQVRRLREVAAGVLVIQVLLLRLRFLDFL